MTTENLGPATGELRAWLDLALARGWLVNWEGGYTNADDRHYTVSCPAATGLGLRQIYNSEIGVGGMKRLFKDADFNASIERMLPALARSLSQTRDNVAQSVYSREFINGN